MWQALGQSTNLLTVALDVTSRSDAEAAVRAAVDRFGRIDVLVNNAASFYAGYFEELTPEQFERQLSVTLIGPMNVTRAVLTEQSTNYAEPSIADYDERRGPLVEYWKSKRPAIWGPGQARARSSRLRARNSLRAASWLAPMQSPLRSRRSPT